MVVGSGFHKLLQRFSRVLSFCKGLKRCFSKLLLKIGEHLSVLTHIEDATL